jgi:hypothetical protein
MILGTPDLTDELTDAEARPLLHWGLAQAEFAADRVQAESAMEAFVAAGGPGEALADRVSRVRRMIKAVNRLATERHELKPEVVAEELAYIFELAGRLPNPPPEGILSTTLAELAGWQAEMDNAAFVWALLTLLGAKPEVAPHPGDEELHGGENNDENE